MNFPWDKSYFKVCFYIIFTFIVIYVFKNTVDIIVYALMHMGGIYKICLKSISALLSVFSVIIIGFAIAYILNPVTEYFIKHNFKRGLSVMAAFFILILFIILVFGAITLSVTDFGKYSLYDGIMHKYSMFSSNYEKISRNINTIADKYDISFFKDINLFDESYFRNIVKYIAQFFIGCIIAVYFLKDKEKILENIKTYYNLFPERLKKIIGYILTRLDMVFLSYIKGQFTDIIIISSLFCFVLSVIGIPFAFPVGILSGFMNLIPYFGTVISFIMTIGITILSGEYLKAIYGGLAILIVQQLDSVFIAPKIVGHSVQLSPVAVIIALAVSANIFGVWGMVFAVPVVSFIKIVIDDFIKRKNDNLTYEK